MKTREGCALKKAAIFIAGSIAVYFITVLVLYFLSQIHVPSYWNIWLTALPVTFVAGLFLLAVYVAKKIIMR